MCYTLFIIYIQSTKVQQKNETHKRNRQVREDYYADVLKKRKSVESYPHLSTFNLQLSTIFCTFALRFPINRRGIT